MSLPFVCPPVGRRRIRLRHFRRSGTTGGYSAGGGRPSAARQSDGYSLVILMVMVTVINILVAKALPLWSTVIQREKEEELIFRGMQYAEALRVYEMRTGGLPTKLEQLIEIEPRCIRKLWKNPLAEDGSWLLIPPGQGQQRPGRNPNQNQPNRGRDVGRNQPPGVQPPPDQSLLWIPGGDNKIGSVPIFGVKSSVGGESVKLFVANPYASGGSTEISEWQFTVDLAKSLIRKIDPANPIVPSMNAGVFDKPWPPGIQPLNVPNTGRERPTGSGGVHAVTPGGNKKPTGKVEN